MKKSWLNTLAAYGAWAVFILLGIFFLITSRNSLGSYLDVYYENSFQRIKEANFINQVFFLIGGLILIVVMIVVEEYFKNGAHKGLLLKRSARVFGVEILFIGAASAVPPLIAGFSPLISLVLALELTIGLLFVWYGYKTPQQKNS